MSSEEANDGADSSTVQNEHSKYFKPILTPMLPLNTFQNKIVYITGGGTGLGKNMALVLSKLGASILIVSRKISVLEGTAKEIQSITGNRVAYYVVDVRNPVDIANSIDYCEETFGGLPDIIINNAAANFISPTERLSTNAVKTIIDIVLTGTFNVTLIMGKRLIAKKKGANFLSITTNYVGSGSGYVVPSACAKSGITTLTKSLAAEWAKYGIRLNAIAPGPIYTEGAFSRLDPTGQAFKEGLSSLPVGRFGTPEELSNFISYIVSDYASWLNGECIVYDGGQLVSVSGVFNKYSTVKSEEWDEIEKLIRSNNNKAKL